MVIKSRYSQEFNRTIPHQLEGPEFSPYQNTVHTATKPTAKKSSLLATLVAAATLASLILPLCFSIKNVQPTSAELHFAVVAEEGYEETDVLTYQLLLGAKIVEEGLLPFGQSMFLMDELAPDSRYTIQIFKNGVPEKTLNFRTKPEEQRQTTVPTTAESPAVLTPVTQPPATQPSATTPKSTLPAVTVATQPAETTTPTETTVATEPTMPYIPPAAPLPETKPSETKPVETQPAETYPEEIPEETINPYDEPDFEPQATANSINSQVQIEFNLFENEATDITYTVEHTVGNATVGTYQYPGSTTSATIDIPAAHQTSTNLFIITISYMVDGISGEKTQTCTVVPPNLLPGISGDPTFTLDDSGTLLNITGTVDPNGANPETVYVYVSTDYSSVFPYYDSATNTFYTGDSPMFLNVADQNATSLTINITVCGQIAGTEQAITSSYIFNKSDSP